MEAIILAGGFGTRLKHIVSDVPKPMAPIDDKGTPFLGRLLDMIKAEGITRVILSTGYKSECIEKYFGSYYNGMEIVYSVEDTPLFTGGAVKKALELCKYVDVFVLNGDTFFAVDLPGMLAAHHAKEATFTVAVKEMFNFNRYGTVDIAADERILAFKEKEPTKKGFINGGIYCIKKNLLQQLPMTKFSLEKDFLEKKTSELKLYAYKSDGYFIDIGIPEDYYRAREEL